MLKMIMKKGWSIRYLLLLGVFALLVTGCANAGKDQSVASEESVTLDGSKSKADFHGQIKKYHWKQVRGTDVTLQSKKTAHPSFVAPMVSEESTLVFRLVTVERGGYISPWRTRDRVRITVKPSANTNLPPVAIADTNVSSVKEGDSIHFSADNSSDSDGQIVSYTWKDETGSLLSNAITFDHTFATVGTHTLTLTVTDDAGLSSSATVTVTVAELQVPIAQIQVSTTSTTVGTTIHFDANASSDADGQIVSYQWIDESNTTLSNQMTLSYAFATSGEYTITLIVMDDDAQEGRASVSIVVEALLVSMDLSANALSLDINETTSLLATANYNDNTSLDVTSSVVWSIANPNILSIDVNGTLRALQSGITQVTAQVGTLSSNTLSITVNTPITLESLAVTPNPVELRIGESLQLRTEGTYSDGSTEMIDVADYIFTDTSVAIADPTGTLEALKVGSTSFRVKVGSRYSGLVFVTVGTELNTTNFNFTNFGSTYTNQTPVNATLTQYDEKRFCMIAGQIKAEDGSPMSGVKVSIFSHPEYGSVITDSNGSYTIPSEGGLSLTMRYAKQGYTTIDRKVYAPVQDWVRSPDVTMLAVDTKVTTIDLNNNTPQMHVSTKVTDTRGSRSTTLVFDGVSRATVIAPDGSARILHSIDVRATEFKTPDSMPSDLPKESAFTYCSDLRIDGTNDNDEILFDAPVVMYVDNFLGFEVGEIVPVGYYDRNVGEWKASDNGVVVRLLDTDNDGVVDALDSTGDNLPNDLDGDGSFADEVAGLQNNPEYVAGKSYWRAEMMHFTPWDHNWPYGPPWDAVDPNKPDASSDDSDTPNDCQKSTSSYVTTKSRTFHEDISVAGTDITLHYSSKRVGASTSGVGYIHVIDASLDTTNAPASVSEAYVTCEIAGRVFKKTVTLNELNTLIFEWDGLDASGRAISGEVKAKVTAVYKYNLVYMKATSTWSQAWARAGSGGRSFTIEGRAKIAYDASKTITLHIESSENTNVKMGNGWSISILQNILDIQKNKIPSYTMSIVSSDDPIDVVVDTQGNIYYSYNNQIKKIDRNNNISIYAGTGIDGFSGDGGLAINATFKSLYGLGIDKSDNIYIFDLNFRLRKIDAKTGIITTITGNGTAGFSGDGGLATEATLNYSAFTYRISALSHDIAEDTEGNIYFPDYKNQRIRKIDTNGIITTIAGNGTAGFSGDGGLATEARLHNPTSIDIDSKGNLYIADWYNNRIRKVDTNGIITTVVGGGTDSTTDSIWARDVALNLPYGLTIDNEDNIIIADEYAQKIRKVDDFGISHILVGLNDTSVYYPYDVDIDMEGNIYIATSNLRKLSVASEYKKYNISLNQILILNQNNTADIFDATGKHLKTIELHTGKALKIFTYDENDRLIAISDRFNQITTITRDAQGNPTTITAPNGQVTTLTIDENGDLVGVAYEDNTAYTFSYFSGSLMDTMTDPNGNIIYHNWDANGRIVEEIDGLGGSYQFLRNINGTETFYSTILPEGETSSSSDTTLANGDTQSTMTLATGESVTATFAADESHTSSLRDGVSSVNTYTTDTLTHQRVLASSSTTQPSGLQNTTTYATTYDGNETYTNSKTQTITNNAKTTTLVTNYNTGTTTLTTPTGRTATSTYDVNTLLTTQSSSGTLTPTTYTYDAKGRVTTETTGTRVTTYTYDAKGNLATVTNPKAETTSYSYDIVDNLTTITYANGNTEHFSYDANGNLLSRTVPTPADHTFAYNGGDLRTNYTSPLKKATTYSYDRSKNLTSITKPSGKTITNTYTNGRLSGTTTPKGTSNYTYLFANKVGSISQGSESFTYSYDGTLLTKSVQSGTLNHTTDFTYNNDFRVTSTTYAGATQTYTYDNDGLLLTSGAYTLTRDPQNAYTTSLTDGTLIQTRSYNNFGEVTQIADNTFTYQLSQRDSAGAITQKVETLNGISTTYDYTYDTLGRLTQVLKDNTLVESYTYDSNGNRATATVHGISTIASYTLDDTLVVYGDNTYTYDADGYLQSKTTPQGTSTYSYGTLGELRQVITPTQTITYKHNANNQRVAKLVNGTITEKYLWANLTTLLAIYDSNDNLKQRFEYADQRMPVSMTDSNGTKYYLHYDQVGTLKAVSDANGNIVKESTYDTFGNILSDTNPTLKVPFGFAGGLYDEDTKLTRFGYRDYDAYTGKWTAKDPIGFAGGDSNLYGYVLGDPVDFVDPSGLIAPYVVYGIYIGGRLVYVGISKYPKKRALAHLKRWANGKFKELKKDLCKADARKYEQSGIERGGLKKDGGLENVINSISKKNSKYKDFSTNKKKYDSLWDGLF